MTNKEEYETQYLIDELAKMPPMVIATAFLYALNYTRYGEDVTKDWTTATQNANALEKAYIEGYRDALQRQEERDSKCSGNPMGVSYEAHIKAPTPMPYPYCPCYEEERK
jgi:hypothetical protein